MYVVPFSMGPLGSPIAHIGVELTDSPYVAVSMRTMTRMGQGALDVLGTEGEFVPCVHSVGYPLVDADGNDRADVAWPCNSTKYISHFPETREIWSYGSGYGGNALLGKKCFALRIASTMARDEGWMAEHMLILGVTPPGGEKKYVAAAFPSACGKTNMAMLIPIAARLEGRDRRRRHRLDEVRRGRPPLRHQPRVRILRRRSRHVRRDQPQRDEDVVGQLRLHQRRQDRRRRRVVGGHERAARAPDRLEGHTTGRPTSDTPAAHPNARFTAPASQCPSIAPEWEDPAGVPISAILFGGRRATNVPARDRVVRLAARRVPRLDHELREDRGGGRHRRRGAVRPLRHAAVHGLQRRRLHRALARDRPQHRGRQAAELFWVNWFRKGDDGKFLWPGFGENSRVLKWVVERVAGDGDAVDTADRPRPLHRPRSIARASTSTTTTMEQLLAVDDEAWRGEVALVEEHFEFIGERLPQEMRDELTELEKRLVR